jgi:DNA-binding MarR family transcriptional regulator
MATDTQPRKRLRREGPNRTPVLGPLARQALRLPIGRKEQLHSPVQKAVLVTVCAFIDAGYSDPSVREIRVRTGLPDPVVVQVIDKLALARLLTIERGDSAARTRSRYTVTLDKRSYDYHKRTQAPSGQRRR